MFSANLPLRIVIGRPEIIDVSLVTNNEITVMAVSSGSSTFIYWDKDGQHAYRINVFTENLDMIKQRIDSLLKELNLPHVYTKISEVDSKILVLGAVQSEQQRKILEAGLTNFKDKIIDLVLLKDKEEVIDIDVQVLELSSDATETLGFSLPANITLTEKGSLGISEAGTKWSSLFKLLNLSRTAFAVTLDFLIQEGKAKILSRPRLSCQSGKEAELLVGGEKPIFTTQVASAGGQGTEVDYKEFGIKLKIRPTVVDLDKIKLA
ncbi:MAG: pilus assembly protein N-terminal domain-containing protein, partial [Candidatus Omnitrophica bacterium]|nr:pilus assembly protein N-terminal domain-containing protein [Candidatus Omnitrophota bacterium]